MRGTVNTEIGQPFSKFNHTIVCTANLTETQPYQNYEHDVQTLWSDGEMRCAFYVDSGLRVITDALYDSLLTK